MEYHFIHYMNVKVRPELIFISNNILSIALLLGLKMPHDDYDDGDGSGVCECVVMGKR